MRERTSDLPRPGNNNNDNNNKSRLKAIMILSLCKIQSRHWHYFHALVKKKLHWKLTGVDSRQCTTFGIWSSYIKRNNSLLMIADKTSIGRFKHYHHLPTEKLPINNVTIALKTSFPFLHIISLSLFFKLIPHLKCSVQIEEMMKIS